MPWIKSLHIVAMVVWFGGLFYLPRLFVYHAMSRDEVANERFKIMEQKLYYYVTSPGALFTLIFGIILLTFNPSYYLHATWLHIKLGLVFLLVLYHFYLGFLLCGFEKNGNTHSAVFYRWVNEVPTLLLVGIVVLAVVKMG